MSERTAEIERKTRETEVGVRLALDPAGDGAPARPEIDVPDGFLGHMLEALAVHGGLGLRVRARGDVHVDRHHTVEDVGIVLGEALREALGERAGVVRFATAHAPLDEALARAVVDLSGRGYLVFEAPEALLASWITPDFPFTLVEDFLHAFADRARLTLHVDVLRGRNPHHAAEAVFKALAVALREAVAVRAVGDARATAAPSTKGTLTS